MAVTVFPCDQAGSVNKPASGFISCVGATVPFSASHDDLTGWTQEAGLSANFGGFADPIGGTNATRINVAGTAANQYIHHASSSALSAATTYAMLAYIKPIVGSTWLQFGVTDGVANSFASYFDLSGAGSVGNNASAGDGTLNCARIATSTNGYYVVSVGGQIAGSRVMDVLIFMANGNGSATSDINQEFYVYQVGV